MIWHFLEIWLLLLAAFVIGCLLGSGLYSVVARSAAVRSQEALADAVGDLIDGVKARFGVAPAWRPEYRPRAEEEAFDEEFAYATMDDRPPVTPARPREGEDRRDRAIPPPAGNGFGADDADWDSPDAEPEVDWEGEPVWDEEDSDLGPAADPRTAAPPKPDLPAMRPAGLSAARNGVPDDLQRIRGIGKRNEELLNELGIFHFSQIAAWTPAEVRWVSNFLSFPERIDRDDWIGQATVLGSGGNTGYIKAAARRRARRQEDSESSGEEAYDLMGEGSSLPVEENGPSEGGVPDFIGEGAIDDDVFEPVDDHQTTELATFDELPAAGEKPNDAGADVPVSGDVEIKPAAEAAVTGSSTSPDADVPPAAPQPVEEAAKEPARPETSDARP